MTDKEKTDDEVTESQKLSKQDKRELEQGLCVNCAITFIIITSLLLTVLVL